MKKIILSAPAILAISTVHAQITISPVGGLNVSSYAASYNGSRYKLRLGPCAGALLDFPLKNNVSLQTGVLYKLNGYKMDVIRNAWGPYGDHQSYRIHAIDIPVKLKYSFSTRKQSSFFVGIGPYLAVNVAASVRNYGNDWLGNPISTVERVDGLIIGSQSSMPRIDAGAGINFGYQAARGLMLCLQGQIGIINQGDKYTKLNNYNFGIIGGYTFKLKKHKTSSEAAQSK